MVLQELLERLRRLGDKIVHRHAQRLHDVGGDLRAALEQGSHAELLKKSGKYAAFCSYQENILPAD